MRPECVEGDDDLHRIKSQLLQDRSHWQVWKEKALLCSPFGPFCGMPNYIQIWLFKKDQAISMASVSFETRAGQLDGPNGHTQSPSMSAELSAV